MELTEEEILNTYKPAQNDNIPQIQIGNLRQYANNLYPISLQKKPKKKKKKLKKTNKLEPLTTLRKRGTSTQTYKNHQTFRSRAYTNLKPQYLNDELKPEIAVKELENYLKNPKAQAKKALRIMNKIDKSQDYNHYFDDQNKIINTHKLKPYGSIKNISIKNNLTQKNSRSITNNTLYNSNFSHFNSQQQTQITKKGVSQQQQRYTSQTNLTSSNQNMPSFDQIMSDYIDVKNQKQIQNQNQQDKLRSQSYFNSQSQYINQESYKQNIEKKNQYLSQNNSLLQIDNYDILEKEGWPVSKLANIEQELQKLNKKNQQVQKYKQFQQAQNQIQTNSLIKEIPANPLVKINQNSQNVTIANIKINQDNQNQNSPPKQNKSNFQNYKKIMVCKPPNLSKNSTNQNFYKLNPPLPQINSSKNSNSKHKNIKNNKQNSQNQNNNNKNQNLNNINNNNQNQNQSLFNQNFLKYNAETLKKMNELNNKLSGHHTNQASGIPERSKFDLESIINAKYKPNQFSQQDKERQKINNKIHDIFNSLQSKLSQKPDFYNKSQLKQESQFNQFNSSQNQSSLNIQSTQD